MSVLCRGKTSASSRRLRQCVSHTKSPFILPAQSFDEAVDVPVALHDRQKAVSSTGPVHWQDRRFPSCVATPSTNNPDDTAKVLRVRQRQSTTNQEVQKIVETTQRQTSHHRFRSSRKSRRLRRYHKLYRDSADDSLTKSAFPKVEVLYVVMGCSETSVLSTRRRRGAKPASCCGSSS